MINKQFLYYTDYNNFQQALNNGDINNNSIVFIANEDEKLIWTQGKVFTDSKTFNNYIKTSDHNLDIKGIQNQIGDYFKDNNKTISDVCSDLQDQIDGHTDRIEDVEEGVGQINDSLQDYAKTADVASEYTNKIYTKNLISNINGRFQKIQTDTPCIIKETLYEDKYQSGDYLYIQPLHKEVITVPLEPDENGNVFYMPKTRKWYYKDPNEEEIVEEIVDGISEMIVTGDTIDTSQLDENGLIRADKFLYLHCGQINARSIERAKTEGKYEFHVDSTTWIMQVIYIGNTDNQISPII